MRTLTLITLDLKGNAVKRKIASIPNRSMTDIGLRKLIIKTCKKFGYNEISIHWQKDTSLFGGYYNVYDLTDTVIASEYLFSFEIR